MIRMFVRHPVADFSVWKQHYESFEAARQSLGVRGEAIFRGAPNANEVTIWHDFDSVEAAQAFMDAPPLAAAMEEAGVVGEPQVWFVERDLPA